MEVILKEDVAKLGSRGDVVKVAEGYGRNYLLPRKLAIQASAGNKAVVEQMKAASVRRSAKEKTQAEELSKQFADVSLVFQRRSSEHDQLFGSVTSGDIADALEKTNVVVFAEIGLMPAGFRRTQPAFGTNLRPDFRIRLDGKI